MIMKRPPNRGVWASPAHRGQQRGGIRLVEVDLQRTVVGRGVWPHSRVTAIEQKLGPGAFPALHQPLQATFFGATIDLLATGVLSLNNSAPRAKPDPTDAPFREGFRGAAICGCAAAEAGRRIQSAEHVGNRDCRVKPSPWVRDGIPGIPSGFECGIQAAAPAAFGRWARGWLAGGERRQASRCGNRSLQHLCGGAWCSSDYWGAVRAAANTDHAAAGIGQGDSANSLLHQPEFACVTSPATRFGFFARTSRASTTFAFT